MDNRTRRLLIRAETQLNQRDFIGAHFAVRKILRHDPRNVSALILAAEIALRQDKRMEAMDLANQLFELHPADLDGARQARLGHICFDNELYDMAAQAYAWVRKKNQADERVLYRGGISLRRLGRMDEAEEWLDECVRRRGDVPDARLQLGHVYKATGRLADAVAAYRKAIELAPGASGIAWWSLADLKTCSFTDEDVAAMEAALAGTKDEQQASALGFALGWAAEQRQDYDLAMDRYRAANAIQARLKPFPAAQYKSIVSGLSAVGADTAPQAAEVRRPTAILVVGLPRSGTTLIEQILSAHSRVQATDELPFLERIALRLEMSGGYPQRLAGLNEEQRAMLRQQYVNGARGYLRGESDYFIDKYPGNFLHIGLVKRIMPDAVVIDARRDPRAIAISAYRQLFGQRGEFASSFDGIHDYYEGYLAMMEHWHAVYPGQIVTQHYETLVADPDASIRALLEACGLDDEPACHEFYAQKRAVTTPSAAQVSRPVYTSSVEQWRRFEATAGEELARLGRLAGQA